MCQFTVDVKDIKEPILPDLDDDFAKSVGNGFDSLELLHDEVENQLRGSLEEHARHGYEDAVVDQVLAISTIEMPSLLVEREVNRLVDDLRSGDTSFVLVLQQSTIIIRQSSIKPQTASFD